MWMWPEAIVTATALAVLVVDLVGGPALRRWLEPVAIAGLAAAAAVVCACMPQAGVMFGGRFAVDAAGWWFKLLFILTAMLTVILSKDGDCARTAAGSPRLESAAEYYLLLLLTVAGMMFLISARDLITVYVSLELATIPLFALAAWRRDPLGGEAGLKYVIVGSIASATLLQGMALLYGLAHSTDLVTIGRVVTPCTGLWLAMALVTVGVGFKLTLVPFHLWAADVYQGAPTPITAYLSVGSKFAGLALALQLFGRMFGGIQSEWVPEVALFAAVTMTLGNLVAIVQDNVKRFMAFSAIAQAGYVMMGFIGVATDGVPAILFYMLIYAATNLAVFAVIVWHANRTGDERIAAYRGLSRLNPMMALAMMIGLFGLAGIPPLAGFVGKFFLFSVASKAGLHWLVVVAAVNSTISLYYYLRIVKEMYIEAPAPEARTLPVTPLMGLTVGVLTAASVLLGIVPVVYQTIYAQTSGWLAAFVP
jgi:NADH-quinone oxidoreductase subunit N